MSIMGYILSQVAANQLPLHEATAMIKELQDLASNRNTEDKIAIIGMACRFPKASNPDEFWRNLSGGVNCIDDFPADRAQSFRELSGRSLIARIMSGNPKGFEPGGDINFVKGGYIRDVDKFDAAFFRIAPKEAMFMDPLQRVFLEVAYEAMEDAGYGGLVLYGAKAGVFVGKDHTYSTMYKYVTEPDEMHLTGSWTGILASRLSYLYNFRGPSMVIDTACSSGLVSVHEACRALNKDECEIAIAGGIHIELFADQRTEGPRPLQMVESSDGQVRTFDKNANGTVWSEGAGALILKPLSKAIESRDHIYAVISGSAINNDGASSGITAPNADAQKELLIRAWKEANIDPETISYIEAHGTGTNLGDPIEIKAITCAFEEFTTKKQFCGVGSVKTNVGHMVASSGIAAAIKVVLALKNKAIPPSINFKSPNPYINFLDSPVYVNDRILPWNATEGSPRRAGVSAFGFSGTNCHVILEEPPQDLPVRAIHESPLLEDPGPQILTLSARNQNTLQELLKRYQSFLEHNTEAALDDICYTANTGRGHYYYRVALVVTSLEDVKQKIARLLGGAPETIWESGICAYKIVSNYETGNAGNELTENDRRQLSAIANQKLKEFLAAGSALDPESAAELCRFYIRGADIHWDELYQDHHLHKVSLPTYPLERIKYWAGPNTLEIEDFQMDSKPTDPLLAGNQAVFKERAFPKATVIGIVKPDEEQLVYIMAQIWARVLGLAEIDIHESFYDMGVNSIIAAQISDQVKQAGLDVSVGDILSLKTIAKICANLKSTMTASHAQKFSGATPELSPSPEESRQEEEQLVYILAQIWAQVFGLAEIDIHESFSNMGGDPRIAAQISGRAKQSGLDVSAQDILSLKTIANICANLNPGMTTSDTPITPYNDIYYVNCLTQLFLSAVKHFQGSIFSFMANDYFVYNLNQTQNGLSLELERREVIPLLEWAACNGLNIEYSFDPNSGIMDSIIDMITDSVRKGSLVILPLDAFYYKHPHHDIFYQKEHHYLYVLVHGFDSERGLFKIFEVNGYEWNTKKCCYQHEVSFQDLITCYQGIIDNPQVNTLTLIKVSKDNSHKIMNDNPDFYKSALIRNLKAHQDDIFKGLSNIGILADQAEPFNMSQSTCFDIMVNSASNHFKIRSILGDQGKYIPLMEDITKMWLKVQDLHLRVIHWDDFYPTLRQISKLENLMYEELFSSFDTICDPI